MTQILDYSAGYPGGAAIRAAGYTGVIRYLRKEGTSRVRPITAAELADLLAHGLDVALVYQHVDQWRTSQGRAAGRHDALWALAQAKACGIAKPRVIYFAVDHDTSPEQWPAIREYMLGAGEVLGLAVVGCYGEYELLDYLTVRGSITWLWQTYAWSTGHNKDNQTRHPRAHLFQRLAKVVVGGIECDVNDVLAVDYGQHPYEEDDMPTAREVAVAVLDVDLGGGYTLADAARMLTTEGKATAYERGDDTRSYPAELAAIRGQLDAVAGAVDELRSRGIGGVTATQLVEILASVRLAPDQQPPTG